MYLSGEFRAKIDLYANINRSLFATDRSPEDFGNAGCRAAEKGFKVIKCAPFDEVRHPNPDDIISVAKHGIDRLVAVRERVGPEVEILVDCHGRFNDNSSRMVAELISPIGIGWFEEPLDPITFPIARSLMPRNAATRVAANSGRDVPTATILAAITGSGTLRYIAIASAPSRSQFAP